ncbi:probable class-V aminotransferase [Stappia aggregata IAM 12614]|uniref:Probable class-V aminotransferase n=1 Tax=Roseibium aggregatum (strain ATCC 25650 / DSM 13394 / JCM 20685 / NBRC 16684 / NCIMB 2208 / IAM 12614 / B1) TaxID=384765 RepID=A0NMN9_ROSAI|nr:aminotransferase class V-fold PLP-dependent enzyme [Roseibium aggregatum]EAV46334.1 probable class-V aminotransferase [Stappia aggregata IAM 12614] [Roseibium aggregatum IAM 12614]
MNVSSFTQQDVDLLRDDTPGVRQLIHFNNAGTGLAPTPVLEAVKQHLDLEATLGGYEAAAAAQATMDAFYTSLAALVGSKPHEIAYVENATRAWDMAFYGIDFRQGDRVVTGRAEYVSNYVALLQMKRRKGIEIDIVEDDAFGQIDLKALKAAIGPKTRLLALTHIPTFSGLINPAEDVGEIARETGVLYLLDACQSAGQIPLNVDEIGCHMLSGTGRKYLRGPRGTGFLYVSDAVLDQVEPPFVDLQAAEWIDEDRYELVPHARRFETWERYVAGQIGLGVAVSYAIGFGMERLGKRICELGDHLRSELSARREATLHDKGERKGGIVTFTWQGETPEQTKQRLSQAGINVSVSRASSARIDLPQRGLDAVVRASVHAFNCEEEIERFVKCLGSLR